MSTGALHALAPFHLVHVGGIGMSALARILHAEGIPVSGSDPKETNSTQALRSLGIDVRVPPDPAAIPEDATIVLSSAARDDNPDVLAARTRGLPMIHRSQLLALLTRGAPTIAVAGTHGKTTTTAMTLGILRDTGADPSFVVGSELGGEGINAARGIGEHWVVEADESDGSLLWLSPDIAIVTNLEPEHLDHYADLAELTDTFRAWLATMPEQGRVIACADDAGAAAIGRADDGYGFDAGNARLTEIAGTLTLRIEHETVKLDLPVPGAHNARNAAAAVLAAYRTGVPVADAVEALRTFGGTRRRFERRGEAAGVTVIDDYAHHPTEITATLRAARARLPPGGRIIALFEPHLFSRTVHLGAPLGAALATEADLVAILPIEPSRERPVDGVTSRIVLDGALAAAPRRTIGWCASRADAVAWVLHHARSGDLVLTLGAGGITTLGDELLAALGQRRRMR